MEEFMALAKVIGISAIFAGLILLTFAILWNLFDQGDRD